MEFSERYAMFNPRFIGLDEFAQRYEKAPGPVVIQAFGLGN